MVVHCARRSSSHCQWRLMHISRKCSRSSTSSCGPMCLSRGTCITSAGGASSATRKAYSVEPLASRRIPSAIASVSLRLSIGGPPALALALPFAAGGGGGGCFAFSMTSCTLSGKKSPSKNGKSRTDVSSAVYSCRSEKARTMPCSFARVRSFSYHLRNVGVSIGGRPSSGRQWKKYSVPSVGGATHKCACSKPQAAAYRK
mmetsp:Transcript_35690/g.104452  ORF Transcript_35690/g.104452 Transcript_35690/m.104452 type:complete len:201 (-) Transcript_35690:1370-1972(-)